MKKFKDLRINRAFNSVLDNPGERYFPFGVNATWLARESGVARKIISEFRHEKTAIQTDTFGRLLFTMPIEARLHLLSKLAGEEISLESVLQVLEPQQLAEFLETKTDLLAAAITYLSPMSRAVIMNAIAQCLRQEAAAELNGVLSR